MTVDGHVIWDGQLESSEPRREAQCVALTPECLISGILASFEARHWSRRGQQHLDDGITPVSAWRSLDCYKRNEMEVGDRSRFGSHNIFASDR